MLALLDVLRRPVISPASNLYPLEACLLGT
jgi:hypothetical protein